MATVNTNTQRGERLERPLSTATQSQGRNPYPLGSYSLDHHRVSMSNFDDIDLSQAMPSGNPQGENRISQVVDQRYQGRNEASTTTHETPIGQQDSSSYEAHGAAHYDTPATSPSIRIADSLDCVPPLVSLSATDSQSTIKIQQPELSSESRVLALESTTSSSIERRFLGNYDPPREFFKAGLQKLYARYSLTSDEVFVQEAIRADIMEKLSLDPDLRALDPRIDLFALVQRRDKTQRERLDKGGQPGNLTIKGFLAEISHPRLPKRLNHQLRRLVGMIERERFVDARGSNRRLLPKPLVLKCVTAEHLMQEGSLSVMIESVSEYPIMKNGHARLFEVAGRFATTGVLSIWDGEEYIQSVGHVFDDEESEPEDDVDDGQSDCFDDFFNDSDEFSDIPDDVDSSSPLDDIPEEDTLTSTREDETAGANTLNYHLPQIQRPEWISSSPDFDWSLLSPSSSSSSDIRPSDNSYIDFEPSHPSLEARKTRNLGSTKRKQVRIVHVGTNQSALRLCPY